jgi:hypothetical protein
MAALPLTGVRIAPLLPTQVHAAAFYVYDTSNFVDIPTDIRRGPSAPFRRLVSKLSSDTFLCKDYGIEEPMDMIELQMYATAFAADKSAMERAVRVVAVNHELRVRNLARAVAQSATPTVKWGAPANTKIVGDLEAAKSVIRAQIGVLPNLLVLPYDVFIALRQAPELKAYFSYVQGGLLTIDNLKSILGFNEIVVSGTIMNSAQEGQVASLGDVWTNEAFMCYSDSSLDPKALNFARTFNWTAPQGSGPGGISTYTYLDDDIDSRVVRARQFTDEKVVASGAGYYLSNVLV